MAKAKQKDPFWTSYSDLMTSLFFVMLVLFIICLIKVGKVNADLQTALNDANVTIEQQNQILKLDSLFDALSKSTSLEYDEEKKMFYSPEFNNIEIFESNSDVILDTCLTRINKVGADLDQILEELYENKDFHYQLVIEGNAAIPWRDLRGNTFNPDNQEMYKLSYRRALALYNQWRKEKHDFRKYNTEIIIAGSGFNGINRDRRNEDFNKRFIIQIIPKISRPTPKNQKQ